MMHVEPLEAVNQKWGFRYLVLHIYIYMCICTYTGVCVHMSIYICTFHIASRQTELYSDLLHGRGVQLNWTHGQPII